MAVLARAKQSVERVTYLYPPLAYRLFFPYIAVASALGEIPLELWLILMCVNVQRWNEQASAAVE